VRVDSVRTREAADTTMLFDGSEALFDTSSPLYISENYFTRDTMLTTSIGRDRQGVAGDPVPYTIRGDNMFTSLLLVSFIVLVTSLSSARHFVLQQLKGFFFQTSNRRNATQTGGELRLQLFLVGLACLLLSISTFILANDYVAQTYLLESYQLVALFFGCYVAYFSLKALLYEMVNNVFFSQADTSLWRQSSLFIFAMEGVLLFPIVLTQVYFDLSFENAAYYYGFVVILTKMLSIYKCWSIFFRQNRNYLQIFLYFCTLEIVPLLILAGSMRIVIDILKITF
jgi:hypothetical protein